jgi:hypothetical protein
MGSPLRYWCRNCDQSFSVKDVSESMPACSKGEKHQLVPIYVEQTPEDEELRTAADFGEGD